MRVCRETMEYALHTSIICLEQLDLGHRSRRSESMPGISSHNLAMYGSRRASFLWLVCTALRCVPCSGVTLSIIVVRSFDSCSNLHSFEKDMRLPLGGQARTCSTKSHQPVISPRREAPSRTGHVRCALPCGRRASAGWPEQRSRE